MFLLTYVKRLSFIYIFRRNLYIFVDYNKIEYKLTLPPPFGEGKGIPIIGVIFIWLKRRKKNSQRKYRIVII